MWKYFFKEYLNYTKKERAGIFILLTIILICICLPFLFAYFNQRKIYDHSELDKDISKLKIQKADSNINRYPENYRDKKFDADNYTNYYEPSDKNYSRKSKGEVFYFDPNTG